MGPIESVVLGLLTIHSGITEKEVAAEVERPVSQVHQIIERLKDKGIIGENLQPTERK